MSTTAQARSFKTKCPLAQSFCLPVYEYVVYASGSARRAAQRVIPGDGERERIFQALDWDEQIREPVAPRTLPERLEGNIRFDRVNFAYEPGRPILKDVSLISARVRSWHRWPYGFRKSTLIRLLGRFYDFDHGMIFIDNIDLQDIRSQDVRRRIGVVLQDFHIFSGSILDNITLGDPRSRVSERLTQRKR